MALLAWIRLVMPEVNYRFLVLSSAILLTPAPSNPVICRISRATSTWFMHLPRPPRCCVCQSTLFPRCRVCGNRRTENVAMRFDRRLDTLSYAANRSKSQQPRCGIIGSIIDAAGSARCIRFRLPLHISRPT